MGRVYKPVCSVGSKFLKYFEPVYVTDQSGMLNPEFEELCQTPATKVEEILEKPAEQARA